MAPRAFASRQWNSWRSWRRSCPCRGSISGALGAVGRRTVRCALRSVPPAPTGGGRRGHAAGHALWALGQATEPRLGPGYGHLSFLPTGLTARHCRHHPGVGDHAPLASSPAGVHSTSPCPCPLAPSTLRVRLRPRHSAWARRRQCAHSGRVLHPCEPVPSRVQSSLSCSPPSVVPRPSLWRLTPPLASGAYPGCAKRHCA
jgi:hypothetical protein